MLNYTDFWPAIWLTIGLGVVVTAALCLLVAAYSPGWIRSRRPHHPAVTLAKRAGHHDDRREPKAA